jgi:alpha-glucosidase
MTALAHTRAALLDEPHHDGSDTFVLERPDELGEDAVVRLRVPHAFAVDEVALRYVRDGEPRAVQAEVDAETETDTWWRAEFPVSNLATRYRWLLAGGDAGFAWLNGAGVVVSLDRGGPDWHLGSVVYEIFPDRFATTGLDVEAPAWAIRRGWDDLPTGRGRATPRELFGGDLPGVEAHLDHIERLGANAIYLTPIFPASSTHRYDASAFDRVDPLLGGDDALDSLARAAHARGIRLIGDLTTNHCGADHAWFRAARDDPDAAEREFFWFDDDGGYESWLGVGSLPKLDWRSPELRRRMEEVARRWLDAGLDGWRIDVANMTGRHRNVDANAAVARLVRSWLEEDELVVAEHFHDYRGDLVPGGWHGVMNYAGFTKPVWTWLRGERELPYPGLPVPLPQLDGEAAVAAMRGFRAGVPWPATLHSWTILDSHDTARFRSVAGSRERHVVGAGLQLTTPGVPMLYAGDELGLEGDWGEDARRPMPWGRPETWDAATLDVYRRLIALRRSSDALARGGIRYVCAGADVVAYLRESASERLLCLASRDDHDPVRLPLASLGARELEPLFGLEATVEGGDVLLPAEGPSFHVWRLIDG